MTQRVLNQQVDLSLGRVVRRAFHLHVLDAQERIAPTSWIFTCGIPVSLACRMMAVWRVALTSTYACCDQNVAITHHASGSACSSGTLPRPGDIGGGRNGQRPVALRPEAMLGSLNRAPLNFAGDRLRAHSASSAMTGQEEWLWPCIPRCSFPAACSLQASQAPLC